MGEFIVCVDPYFVCALHHHFVSHHLPFEHCLQVAKCLRTPLWSRSLHVSLFLGWCSHVCRDGVVHVFAPLFPFLCAGTQRNKANAIKLKGARSWCFLQLNKTMNLDLRLLLFFLFTFFYFSIVLYLVVLLPFVLFFMQEV